MLIVFVRIIKLPLIVCRTIRELLSCDRLDEYMPSFVVGACQSFVRFLDNLFKQIEEMLSEFKEIANYDFDHSKI